MFGMFISLVSRGNWWILGRKAYQRPVLTLKMWSIIIARAPITWGFPIRYKYPWYSGWSHSITEPVQNSRKIRGDESNEMNIMVMRPFSRTWEIVSQPDPVVSIYAAWFELRIARQESGDPFGEILTCRPRRERKPRRKPFGVGPSRADRLEWIHRTCPWLVSWLAMGDYIEELNVKRAGGAVSKQYPPPVFSVAVSPASLFQPDF
jgi:hypothetical protein